MELTELIDEQLAGQPVGYDLLDRGWVAPDADGRLTLTEAGLAGRTGIMAIIPGVQDRIHRGIPDEDYVAALKVLRRVIANVAGMPPR